MHNNISCVYAFDKHAYIELLKIGCGGIGFDFFSHLYSLKSWQSKIVVKNIIYFIIFHGL